jgi:outer membrane protein
MESGMDKLVYWTGPIGLALGACALGLHLAHRPPKIAYAETATLMTEFSEAIKARKQFGEKSKEWDGNIKALNDSLNTAMEKLKTEYEKASPARKEELRTILQKRNEDLQRYTNAVKKMSDEKEKELMGPVIQEMNAFMKTWGNQHGYSLILGTTNGGNILQADAGLDVTAGLLRDMNDHFKDLPLAESAKATAAKPASGTKTN